MNQQAMPSAPSLTHFAGLRLEYIDAVYLHAELAILLVGKVDIRLAEDYEEIAFAGVLEVLRHVQVSVHASFKHWNAAKLAELGRMRLVVEGAGDQGIERSIASLTGGGNKISTLNRAKLGADEDGSAFFHVPFHITSLSTDEIAWPRRERGEGDFVLLMRLLHAGGLQILQDHLREALLRAVFRAILFQAVDQLVVFIHTEHAVGRGFQQ